MSDKYFLYRPTKEEIIKSYSNDINSDFYVRKNIRPTINWVKGLLYLLAFLLIEATLIISLYFCVDNKIYSIVVPIAFAFFFVIIHIKPLTIWGVRVYQRYAPDKIRNKCRFEPSCSEYMILAIQKYGFIKGFVKGINRLHRCKPPNRGFDLP